MPFAIYNLYILLCDRKIFLVPKRLSASFIQKRCHFILVLHCLPVAAVVQCCWSANHAAEFHFLFLVPALLSVSPFAGGVALLRRRCQQKLALFCCVPVDFKFYGVSLLPFLCRKFTTSCFGFFWVVCFFVLKAKQ